MGGDSDTVQLDQTKGANLLRACFFFLLLLFFLSELIGNVDGHREGLINNFVLNRGFEKLHDSSWSLHSQEVGVGTGPPQEKLLNHLGPKIHLCHRRLLADSERLKKKRKKEKKSMTCQ